LSALTLIGAAGLGISGGWATANPSRLRSRLLLVLPAALALPVVVLALTAPTAAAVSLAGVLVGFASRLLLDFALTRKATAQGRY
jgi:hypothetical protein